MYSRTLKILLLRKKAKCAPADKGKKARSLGKTVFFLSTEDCLTV